jgi:hypothetical protein
VGIVGGVLTFVKKQEEDWYMVLLNRVGVRRGDGWWGGARRTTYGQRIVIFIPSMLNLLINNERRMWGCAES